MPVTNNRRNRTSFYRNSQLISSPRHSHDTISYAKPAEIYVYARKRPLLPTEMNFQDAITVPDNKRILITENKSNLDCTPLLKKVEKIFNDFYLVVVFFVRTSRPNFNSIKSSDRMFPIVKYSNRLFFHFCPILIDII